MNILFLGDIIGKPGRDALYAELPRLRRQSRQPRPLRTSNWELKPRLNQWPPPRQPQPRPLPPSFRSRPPSLLSRLWAS